MKHTIKVTIILVFLFVAAQIIGLYSVNQYIQVTDINGTISILHANTSVGETPQLEEDEKTFTFLPIIFMIIIMSIIFLFIIKVNLGRFWKYGFFLGVFFALSIVFGVFMNKYIAFALASVLALWKVFRPNPYIHNFTELFMYGGIAIIILPLLNIYSAIGLLIAVSIYDMYAVWKSKHMITMAKFQSQSKAFAGIVIPYSRKEFEKDKQAKSASSVSASSKVSKSSVSKQSKSKESKKETTYENIEASDMGPKTAILGGGDIGFTLIFSAVVMEFLIITMGISKSAAFFYALIPAAGATIALIGLFILSKKGKFYPAMPPISAGCLIGFGIIFLLI